jgi:predicted amidohydrolase
MSSVRIAVAATPPTATLERAVPAAVDAVEQAGRLGARIVCLPETGLPGHRLQAGRVPHVGADELERAVEAVATAAARAHVVAIVGVERPTPAGREIVSVVLDADGTRLGEQAKRQIDPDEEPHYVAGSGRRTFAAGGLTFAVAICHEAFRYPEIVRAAVLDGAQVVFVPHFVAPEDGALPERWCDAASSYHEKALLCRALENGVYVAGANVSGPHQGSASCVIAPHGSLVAQVPYGAVGVAVADVDPSLADRRMARRLAPERNAAAAHS